MPRDRPIYGSMNTEQLRNEAIGLAGWGMPESISMEEKLERLSEIVAELAWQLGELQEKNNGF